MLLSQALALPPEGGTLSLVGAGGKTSLMLALSRELADTGARVVCTTTTHILRPGSGEADELLTGGWEKLPQLLGPGKIVFMGEPATEGKLSAPPKRALSAAAKLADWLIVEADGSHRLPVKAPAEYEPRLFEPSAAVIAAAGLTALGRPIGEVCHRSGLACAVLNVSPETRLTPELLARLLCSERGQFKNVGNAGRFRVLLNQADDRALAELGGETARQIQKLLPGCRVVVAALRQEQRVKEVYPC